MAVAATDLKFYLSANRPTADTGTSGGVRSTTVQLLARTNADAMNTGSGEKVKLTSTTTDTMNCTLQGYSTTGVWLTETFALTGVTPKESTNTYLHLCSVILASAAAGTVTVAGVTTDATIHTIPVTETGAARMFLLAKANAAGGAEKKLYEKLFIGNGHATDGAIEAKIWLYQGAGAILKIALEESADAVVTGGSETTANRATAPTTGGTYTFVDAATSGAALTAGDAADGNLIAGEYQGVWVELTLAAGLTPDQDTQWTPQIDATAT